MAGNHVPGRRRQAQVLGDKPGRSRATRSGTRRVEATEADPGTAEIRVEDLGNGRARLNLEISWPLALKVLDLLTDSSNRRSH
jgi:hypothetical protein